MLCRGTGGPTEDLTRFAIALSENGRGDVPPKCLCTITFDADTLEDGFILF